MMTLYLNHRPPASRRWQPAGQSLIGRGLRQLRDLFRLPQIDPVDD